MVNGTVNVTNTTLSGNSAAAGTGGDGADGGDGFCIGGATSKQTVGGGGGNGGNAALARGGAMFMANGTLVGRNATLAFNGAIQGIAGTGGPVGAGTAFPYSSIAPGMPGVAQAAQGGGVLVVAGTLTLTSTIVSDNTANGSGAGGRDIHGAATANNSVIESSAGATITGSNNVFADPQLAALANNGGATQTHAPAATSPAVNTGSNPLALTTDQRGTGFPRQFGGGVDIGAFERQSAGAPPPPAISAPVTPVTLNAANLDIQGTAPPGALVRIYSDLNNDGLINGGDAIVASQQLGGGQTSFSISTPLLQNAANNFLATQSTGTESAPTDVTTITEDSQAPGPPTVFTPAGPVNFVGATFDLSGSTEADSLVRVYRDVNNNGVIDTGDTVVGSHQLSGGSINFSVTVPLNSSTTNDFLATATDSAQNESMPTDVATITEVTVTQAPQPTVTTPAANVLVNSADFIISGTAQAGLLVRVYSDDNNNGAIDGADAVVGTQQLATGQTGFAITVTLAQNAANFFTVTAEGTYFTESAPSDVPTITDDAGFSGNPPGNSTDSSCTSAENRGLWFLLACLLGSALVNLRQFFSRTRCKSK